jgi:YD repeat-containing protein
MNVTYDPKTDTLSIVLRPGPVAESDEDKPDVILDYDDAGRLVGLEIQDASKQVPDFASMEFRVAV